MDWEQDCDKQTGNEIVIRGLGIVIELYPYSQKTILYLCDSG